jgi:hypothetical protein
MAVLTLGQESTTPEGVTMFITPLQDAPHSPPGETA